MVDSGKLQHLSDLTGNQRRQLIDTQQAFEAWRVTRLTRTRRFNGSMRWAKRGSVSYLLRKVGSRETSLGPRSATTEAAYAAFLTGRAENKERLAGLADTLDRLAPINRAMKLGRIPTIAARILRRCDEAGLLGEQLFVVGTNALFAYEVLAGVAVESDIIASHDIGLLYDARRSISLAWKNENERGFIGLLRTVDRSFSPLRARSYRAANRDGYMVDLIRPEPKEVFRDRLPAALTDLADDLEAAPIFGLTWLVNTPKLEAIPLDERGYPLRMVVIDPRAFALHKAWLSQRPERDRLKATRDFQQARAAAIIAQRYLNLSFATEELSAMPEELRRFAQDLVPRIATPVTERKEPNW